MLIKISARNANRVSGTVLAIRPVSVSGGRKAESNWSLSDPDVSCGCGGRGKAAFGSRVDRSLRGCPGRGDPGQGLTREGNLLSEGGGASDTLRVQSGRGSGPRGCLICMLAGKRNRLQGVGWCRWREPVPPPLLSRPSCHLGPSSNGSEQTSCPPGAPFVSAVPLKENGMQIAIALLNRNTSSCLLRAQVLQKRHRT